MEKYLYSIMCKTKSKLLCILDVKKPVDTKQQSISIHPTPLTALSSLHISHLDGSHSLTSDLRPQLQRCRPLITPWSTPGTSTWRWHLVAGGLWLWYLLVTLACGTCLWYLLVCQNCGTWHHHHLVVAPGRGPLLNWRSSWCLQLPPGTKLPPDRRSTPRWWSRTPLTPPINSSDLISR